jgi:chromosome segregation ATPase
MQHKCACFIVSVFILLFSNGSPLVHAQEPTDVNQRSETQSPRAEQKLSQPNAGRSITPLTIEQIRANLPSAPADRFEFLRRQRKITLEAIAEASSQLTALTGRLSLIQTRKTSLEDEGKASFPPPFISKERIQSDLVRAKADLADAGKKLAAAKVRPGTSPEEMSRLEREAIMKESYVSSVQDALNNYDQRRKDEEKRRQDAETALKAATEELARVSDQRDQVTQSQLSYQRLLGEIDDMVNQLFIASDATNSFKLKMSIAFSALVGVVIVGFFFIAWSNEAIKETIFSNESGIQFITMFAIVISVILFGIIGVLESKELSALLGGLSGYILGKSRSA